MSVIKTRNLYEAAALLVAGGRVRDIYGLGMKKVIMEIDISPVKKMYVDKVGVFPYKLLEDTRLRIKKQVKEAIRDFVVVKARIIPTKRNKKEATKLVKYL